MKDTRKETLLSGRELSLAVEGRYTNLRIWISKDKIIRMRLDKYMNYSVPLWLNKIGYLKKEYPHIKELATKYGFETPIENLDDILNITSGMKERPCLEW